MMVLIVLPFLVAACAGSAPVEVQRPADSLLDACAAPVSLPTRDLTQAEVERLWGADRAALRDCGERHAVLATWSGEISARRDSPRAE